MWFLKELAAIIHHLCGGFCRIAQRQDALAATCVLLKSDPIHWHLVRSAVLAHWLLQEKLNVFGVLGCLLCIVGSLVIVLHAPEVSCITRHRPCHRQTPDCTLHLALAHLGWKTHK